MTNLALLLDVLMEKLFSASFAPGPLTGALPLDSHWGLNPPLGA